MKPLSLSQVLRILIAVIIGYALKPYLSIGLSHGFTNFLGFAFGVVALILFRKIDPKPERVVSTLYSSFLLRSFVSFFYGLANAILGSFLLTILILILAWCAWFFAGMSWKSMFSEGLVLGLYVGLAFVWLFSIERTDSLLEKIRNFKYTLTENLKGKLEEKKELSYIGFEDFFDLDFVPSVMFYLTKIAKILKPFVVNLLIWIYNTTGMWRLYKIVVGLLWVLEFIQHSFFYLEWLIYFLGSYSLRLVLTGAMLYLFGFGIYRSSTGLCELFSSGDFSSGGKSLLTTCVVVLCFTAIRGLLKTEIPLRQKDRITYSNSP